MTVGFEIDLALCFSNLPLVASLVSSASLSRCGFDRATGSFSSASHQAPVVTASARVFVVPASIDRCRILSVLCVSRLFLVFVSGRDAAAAGTRNNTGNGRDP